jgi:hypothetical protein
VRAEGRRGNEGGKGGRGGEGGKQRCERGDGVGDGWMSRGRRRVEWEGMSESGG